MYRSVGDDTNTALFTDDYLSQATAPTHAPLMRDPVKRTAQTVTAPAPAAPATEPTSFSSDASGYVHEHLWLFGLVGVAAVAGIFFLTRKG